MSKKTEFIERAKAALDEQRAAREAEKPETESMEETD